MCGLNPHAPLPPPPPPTHHDHRKTELVLYLTSIHTTPPPKQLHTCTCTTPVVCALSPHSYQEEVAYQRKLAPILNFEIFVVW